MEKNVLHLLYKNQATPVGKRFPLNILLEALWISFGFKKNAGKTHFFVPPHPAREVRTPKASHVFHVFFGGGVCVQNLFFLEILCDAEGKGKGKAKGQAEGKGRAKGKGTGQRKRFLYVRSRLVAALALPRGSGHFPGDRESEVPREN